MRAIIPIIIALVAILPCASRAQSIVVAPPVVGDGIARAAVEQALAQWLVEHGRHVLPLDPQLRKDLEPCLLPLLTTPPPCAYEYLRRSGADQVLIAWVESDRAQVAILVDQDLYYDGHDEVGEFAAAEWKPALQQALNAARRRETRGMGPWLELSGRPAEAEVLVDDAYLGHLDGVWRLAQGTHQIEVRASGFSSRFEVISLPTPTSYASFSVELEVEPLGVALARERSTPAAGHSALVSRTRRLPRWTSTYSLVTGATLAATGAVLFGVGAWRQRHSGCDDETCDGSYGPRVGVPWFVAGGVTSFTGIAVLSWGLYARIAADRDSTTLSLAGRF